MVFLTKDLWFPPAAQTHESGILAVGGDLSVERLMLAYESGIFPWFNEDDPLLWWCPDERMVLFPEKLHVAKSMRPLLNKNAFHITFNKAFEEVILSCSKVKRKGQKGTWLNQEMISAYLQLHDKGFAHSVEAWQNGQLLGGLYGIYLEKYAMFCGESMFSKVSNASKYAFIKMVYHYQKKGVKLIDCQVYTQHLERLGAELIPRDNFLNYLT